MSARRPPKTLHFAVGTALLTLGGCTDKEAEKVHVNPGPEEQIHKPDDDHTVNVGAVEDPDGKKQKPDGDEDPRHEFDEDGDGIPDYAPNPGPQELEEPQPTDEDKKKEPGSTAAGKKELPPKHVNPGPK